MTPLAFHSIKFKSVRNSLTVMLAIFVSGCTSKPNDMTNILRSNERITIQSPNTIPKDYEFTFSNEKFGDNIKTGAKAGAGTGAGVSIGLCLLGGPAFLPCALIVGSVGALIGTGVGASVGTLYGVTQDLSVYDSNNIDSINAKINNYIVAQNPQNSFVSIMKQSASERFQIDTSPTDSKVTILFTGMGLNHMGDDSVVLITQSQVTVTYIDKSGNEQKASKFFEYISPPNNVESWANENEIFYRQHFDRAYRTMAENIITTLSY